MPDQTAEEAKARNIEAMGKELGEVYSGLWQETALLCSRWSEFIVLFGTKPTRTQLMNKAAPKFFHAVQDALFESIVLHIARMVDPPKSVGKANLSLPAVKELDKDAGIHKLVDKAVANAEIAREWRHRVLAHRDRALALEGGTDSISALERKQVQAMIDSIVAVVNGLSARHLDSETVFHLGVGPGGAISLIDVLDAGVTARDAQIAKMLRGEFDPADLVAKDL